MSDTTFGIVTIAYGEKAQRNSAALHRSVRRFYPKHTMPITHIAEDTFPDRATHGRLAKLYLPDLSPYDVTLYLDADTRLYQPLDALLNVLHAHEFVATLSQSQGRKWAWHVGDGERDVTATLFGHTPVQTQGGVFGFHKTDRVRAFFAAWRDEWERYPTVADQCAMLRALRRVPLRAWWVGREFNGGGVIAHLHGSI